MFTASGSYTGNGTSQSITGLTFQPDVIVIKATNAVTAGAIYTSTLGANAGKLLTADAVFSGGVTSFDADGFSIGSDARVNTNLTEYMWFAASADADDLAVFEYTGDGTDNRDVGSFVFTPNMAWVLPENAERANWRTDEVAGDLSQFMDQGNVTTNRIQSLGAGSIQVGSGLNTGSAVYHVVVFKEAAGTLSIVEYTGNATDNTDIAHGLGVTPIFVWIQSQSGNEPNMVRFADMTGDSAISLHAGSPVTDRIQAVDATNVQIGADADVNESAQANTLVAFGNNPGIVNPTISSIVPDEGPKAGGTTITITGTGFAAGAAVTVGGANATGENVINDTTMTAVTPAGTVGAQDVVVTNTDTGTVTESGGFTYTQSNGWWYWDHARRRRNA
jgi:hypothetical protein